MPIVGDNPETGFRIEVERSRDGGPPWRYEGHCITPSARFFLVATVALDGLVRVELAGGAPPALGEKARLLLRAAWKHAHEDEVDPPHRIVRWRADR
jgi:hypothetical protein